MLEGFAGLGVCRVENLKLVGGECTWRPFGPMDEGGMGFPPSSDLAISAAPSPPGYCRCAFKVLAPSAAARSLPRYTAAISQSEVSTKPTSTNLQCNRPPAPDIESRHLHQVENKLLPNPHAPFLASCPYRYPYPYSPSYTINHLPPTRNLHSTLHVLHILRFPPYPLSLTCSARCPRCLHPVSSAAETLVCSRRRRVRGTLDPYHPLVGQHAPPANAPLRPPGINSTTMFLCRAL
jgi:hypothetical protein